MIDIAGQQTRKRTTSVKPVTEVDLESVYQRMELHETNHDDANMVRAIIQQFVGIIRRYEQLVDEWEELYEHKHD